MKEKDKSKKSTLSEFVRYTRGEMTKREENAFQRKLQKDPFAEEALEGFSEISPREAAEDIDRLGKRLMKRIRRTERIVFYRIAASVAVLVIISSVFIIIERNKSSRQLSQVTVSPSPVQVTDSNQLTKSLVAESKNAIAHPEIVAGQGMTNVITDTAVSAKIESPSLTEPREELAQTEKKDTGLYNAEYMIAASSAAKSEVRSSALTVRGKILSSEDSLPVAGASVVVKGTSNGALTDRDGNFSINLTDGSNPTLVASFIGMETKEFKATGESEMKVVLDPSQTALNELVVVGYGVSKRSKAAGVSAADEVKANNEASGYTPPTPVDGQENFEKYVEKNIRKPASLPEGERVVVIISFIVTDSGSIENIKVISSQDQKYSDEAVRLIKEGPAWKPADKNGKKIEETVSLRIVFR